MFSECSICEDRHRHWAFALHALLALPASYDPYHNGWLLAVDQPPVGSALRYDAIGLPWSGADWWTHLSNKLAPSRFPADPAPRQICQTPVRTSLARRSFADPKLQLTSRSCRPESDSNLPSLRCSCCQAPVLRTSLWSASPSWRTEVTSHGGHFDQREAHSMLARAGQFLSNVWYADHWDCVVAKKGKLTK